MDEEIKPRILWCTGRSPYKYPLEGDKDISAGANDLLPVGGPGDMLKKKATSCSPPLTKFCQQLPV